MGEGREKASCGNIVDCSILSGREGCWERTSPFREGEQGGGGECVRVMQGRLFVCKCERAVQRRVGVCLAGEVGCRRLEGSCRSIMCLGANSRAVSG